MSTLFNQLFDELESSSKLAGGQQALFIHRVFHTDKNRWPDEMCVFCQQEVEEIKADHIQGEVNDIEWLEQEIYENE